MRRYEQLTEIIVQKKPKTIVEVGVHRGDRAIQMLAAASRTHEHVHYWGFDLFEDADEKTDRLELNVKSHETLESVSERIGRFRINGNHSFTFDLVRGNTHNTLTRGAIERMVWRDPTTGMRYRPYDSDFAFIDGGHSVQTIRNDLTCLQNCGTIVMDDYYAPDASGASPDTGRFGCNVVVPEFFSHWTVIPVADPVAGGGMVRMVLVE